jgi:hypothetical protein
MNVIFWVLNSIEIVKIADISKESGAAFRLEALQLRTIRRCQLGPPKRP